MGTTFLSDAVISPTELRARQKHWLATATENVVTIVSGHKKFALVNRERISKLYAQIHYSELVIRYCQELLDKKIKSEVFPWTEQLNAKEKLEFYNELVDTIINASSTGDWLPMEHLIEDWKATAQAIGNPALTKALLAKEDPSKYVRAKDQV